MKMNSEMAKRMGTSQLIPREKHYPENKTSQTLQERQRKRTYRLIALTNIIIKKPKPLTKY